VLVVGGGGASPAVGGCGGIGAGGVRLCWWRRRRSGRQCAPALGESGEAARGGARAGELLEPRRRRAGKPPGRCGSRPRGGGATDRVGTCGWDPLWRDGKKSKVRWGTQN
jgi:hypothetical protein